MQRAFCLLVSLRTSQAERVSPACLQNKYARRGRNVGGGMENDVKTQEAAIVLDSPKCNNVHNPN